MSSPTILGTRIHTQINVSVNDVDRQSGCYVLGVQGTGKSSLLESMIIQDIRKNYSVILLDPHGDLIERVLATMPQECLRKTYLLDIEDVAYPLGVNLFSSPGTSPVAQTQARDRVLHVFQKCFPETQGVLLEKYLGNIAPVFFTAKSGYAMTDIPRFLRDDGFRTRLLQGVRYMIREFWEQDYGTMSPSTRKRETESLATRINKFMRSPISGNIIGQSKTTIDFRRAIENKEILLIRLPIKTLKEDAELIGTMLVAQIHAAIFSFADTPAPQRPGFSLYVDEFQHFATSDFSEMFTEGRKFGSRVTVAHQFTGQLPTELFKAMPTAFTKVCFQTTIEDAPKMAPLFMKEEPKMQKEDIYPDVVKKLLTYGHPNPTVDRFIKQYLRPLQFETKAGAISVDTYQQKSVADVLVNPFVLFQQKQEPPQVKNPIMYLEPLLYEAQIKGDWQLPIPPEVLLGFSNCGVGFLNVLKQTPKKTLEYLLTAQAVSSQQEVDSLYKKLWGDRCQATQLLDFLIQLRSVMSILVEHPLGEKKPLTPGDVAQTILNLPRRTALVRIGPSQQYTVKTKTIPQMPQANVLRQRKQQVQDQTRQKYCRPRAQVEQEIEQRLTDGGAPAGAAQPPPPNASPPNQKGNPPPQATRQKSICPYCKREQINRHFCSLCGKDMTKPPPPGARFTEVDDE